MKLTITGNIAPFAHLQPAPGEGVWLSSGALMAYLPGVEWELRVPGGVSGAMRRMFSGEGLTLTYATARAADDWLTVAANAPGYIEVWDLADGPVTTTRGSFLAAWGPEVDINVTVARAGAALFGGAGLLLQRISGSGTVLIHGSGDRLEQRLDADQTIVVSSGNLAAFAATVDYSIKTVGGVRKALFGGEGIFMTRLTGPGRVLLQTIKRGTAAKAYS